MHSHSPAATSSTILLLTWSRPARPTWPWSVSKTRYSASTSTRLWLKIIPHQTWMWLFFCLCVFPFSFSISLCVFRREYDCGWSLYHSRHECGWSVAARYVHDVDVFWLWLSVRRLDWRRRRLHVRALQLYTLSHKCELPPFFWQCFFVITTVNDYKKFWDDAFLAHQYRRHWYL